jgi:muconolactone D-isomerase
MEFLVHMAVGRIDAGDEREKQLRQEEAARSRELAEQGILVRLWRVPGRRENWGIWRADDCDQLHNAFVSLPLFPFLTITVHPLATHPNDPKAQSSVRKART